MILNDAQLAKILPDVAFSYHLGKSEIESIRETIADLRRQLAELDRMIAVITKMPGSGALDAYVQEHAKAAYDSGYIAGADSVLSKVREQVDRAVLAESEWLNTAIEVRRDPNNAAGLTAVFFCGTPLHHFNEKQKTDAYVDRLRKAIKVAIAANRAKVKPVCAGARAR